MSGLGDDRDDQKAPSFPAWATSKVDLLRKTVGIGSLLTAAFAIYKLEPAQWLTLQADALDGFLEKHATERGTLFLIQALACLLLAVLTPRPGMSWLSRVPNLSNERRDIAIKACRRIQYFLVGVFVMWGVYYLVSAISMYSQAAVLAQGQKPTAADVQFDRVVKLCLSTGTALVIYWLYLEMAVLTVATDSTKKFVTSLGDDAMLHRVISALVSFLLVFLVWYTHVQQVDRVLNTLDMVIGCLSGVALCLVAGRLGSEYINPGPITLGVLYFYGVIQPAAAVFHTEPVVLLAATTLALPLKILLWLVCVWAFTSGILGEYAYDLRELIQTQAKRRSGKAA